MVIDQNGDVLPAARPRARAGRTAVGAVVGGDTTLPLSLCVIPGARLCCHMGACPCSHTTAARRVLSRVAWRQSKDAFVHQINNRENREQKKRHKVVGRHYY